MRCVAPGDDEESVATSAASKLRRTRRARARSDTCHRTESQAIPECPVRARCHQFPRLTTDQCRRSPDHASWAYSRDPDHGRVADVCNGVPGFGRRLFRLRRAWDGPGGSDPEGTKLLQERIKENKAGQVAHPCSEKEEGTEEAAGPIQMPISSRRSSSMASIVWQVRR